jgi:hypothetical protein
MSQLDPQTPLEMIFATEMMSANWRLRRCRIIEAGLALEPEPDEKTQRSVDRARAQSHNILRRSLSELRKLQTERAIRDHIEHAENLPGLAETSKILRAAPGSFCHRAATATERSSTEPGSFCKSASTPPASSSKIPRNAPCPCRSGLKYKRCCGNPVAQSIKEAA